jgi:MATE family, multidrug efflux pump
MVTQIATPATAHTQARTGGIREVAALAYPIVLTQLSQTAMHMIDCIFVGRLGAAQLGALGFAGIWLWTVFCVFSGCANGIQTFVSQAHGAGDEASCGRWVWQGVYAVVPAAAFALLLFALGADAFLRLLGTTPEIHDYALAYVRMRPPGFACLALWMVLASFFRGLGDTRTPLIATLVANAANALLAYALVFGHFGLPAWGVAGAGVATSIAEALGAALLFAALFRPRVSRVFQTRPIAPDLRQIRRFLRTGAPIGGQWLLDMSAFALFTTLVARMGNVSMAANQAMLSLLSLSFMQAVGISLAAMTLVGRYKGARDLDSAARSFRSAVKLGLVLAAVVAGLFVSAPEFLLRLYVDDPQVLAFGRPLLALGAAFQLFDCMAIVAAGSLRGAGDTRWPLFVQTSLAWTVRLPLAWLFAVTLGGGVVGAWYAEFVFVATLSAAFVFRFRSGAWRRVEI